MTEPIGTPAPPPNRSRWIVVIVVLALVGGIAVAASQWSKPQPGQSPMPAPEPQAANGPLPEGHPPLDGSAAMPPDGKLPPGHPSMDGSGGGTGGTGGMGGAMGSMPPMSSAGGDPGYVSPEGVKALVKAGLAPTNRRVWVDEVPGVDVSKLSAKQKEIFLRHANSEDCVCGYTVATCRNFNPPCSAGPGKAAALLDSVRTGKYKDAAGLRERPKASTPSGHPTNG